MTEQERDFKGVWIPKQVWLDARLGALDKVILTEVDSLDQGEKGCFASNKHIADFCQCSESKVSKSISLLIKLGYLYVQNFDGRQRELKSRLSNFAKLPSKNYKADEQNLQESNTKRNTVNNTNKKESKKDSFNQIIADYVKKFSEPEKSDIADLLGEWLKARKAKRAAMTDRAIQMNIDKLDTLAKGSNMTVAEYLREIICRGWAAFYAISDYSKRNANGGKTYGENGIAVSNEPSELDDLF